jgi:hypothetical protein
VYLKDLNGIRVNRGNKNSLNIKTITLFVKYYEEIFQDRYKFVAVRKLSV